MRLLRINSIDSEYHGTIQVVVIKSDEEELKWMRQLSHMKRNKDIDDYTTELINLKNPTVFMKDVLPYMTGSTFVEFIKLIAAGEFDSFMKVMD